MDGATIADRYQILAEIGRGGMGRVYRARDLHTGRTVAVKVIARAQSGDERTARRFEREARIVSRLEHPNVVRLYDFGHGSAGEPYLVMELIDAPTLAAILHAEGALSPRRAMRIGLQIARALVAVHAEGIVHSDLKPSNVLVSNLYGERDIVHVADFGVAHMISADVDESARVMGTPHYASPEQLCGEALDAQSDLYSLGVVLYEAVTGRRPFDATTAKGLCYQHLHEPVPSPGSVRGRPLPEWLEQLIVALLAKDPRARPESAARVVEALRGLGIADDAASLSERSLASTPRPPSIELTATHTVRLGGVRRLATAVKRVALVGLAAVALTFASAGLWRLHGRAHPHDSPRAAAPRGTPASVPERALASAPESALPSASESALPSASESALPSASERLLASTPGSALASVPERTLAPASGAVVRGSTRRLPPAVPERAPASAPGDALASAPAPRRVVAAASAGKSAVVSLRGRRVGNLLWLEDFAHGTLGGAVPALGKTVFWIENWDSTGWRAATKLVAEPVGSTGNYALHMRGGKHTGFGRSADLGTDARWDFRGYKKLIFRARGTQSDGAPFVLTVGVLAAAAAPPPLGPCKARCWDRHQKKVRLRREFAQYEITFDELKQAGWGTPVPLDLSNVQSVGFYMPRHVDYEFWLDAIRLAR